MVYISTFLDGAEAGAEMVDEAIDGIKGALSSDEAKEAGAAVSQGASAAGDAVSQGASAAGDAASQGAAIAGDAASQGAAIAGEAAAQGADLAVKGGKAISGAAVAAYNSEGCQQIIGAGFGALDEAYKMNPEDAKGKLRQAAGLAAGSYGACVNFMRIDIFRDYLQIVGTVFANSYAQATGALFAAYAFFGGIANIVTLNLGAAFHSEEASIAGFVIAFLLALAAFFAYVWLICASGIFAMKDDELRGGKEAKSFAETAKESKDTIYYAEKIITLCLAVYLPIGTYCAQIIFCDSNSYIVQLALSSDKVTSCAASNYISNLRGFSYLVFIFFLMPLVILLGYAVKQHMPKGNVEDPTMTFDSDGMAVKFDDKVYNDLVQNDINQQLSPFRNLYEGFEQKYALYKVGMLVWKLFVTGIAVAINAASKTQTVAAVFQFILLLIQAIGFWYMKPFIDDGDDSMDASGRITAAWVAFAGIFASLGLNNGGTNFLGSIIFIINLINNFIMVYFTLVTMGAVKSFMKNTTGRFTFSNTCNNTNGISALNAISTWDIQKEIKHRVWQAFWSGVLLEKCANEEGGEKVPARLVALQKATIDNGLAVIENHWNGQRNAQVVADREVGRQDMEGVDMYWSDKTSTIDGELNSKTFFGKLIVIAYPFTIRIAYDDCDDVTVIKDSAILREFVELNLSPDIQAKRTIRKQLRVLSNKKTSIHWPFSQIETHVVDDGFDEKVIKDADGNERTQKIPHRSEVKVEVFYTNGVINISTGDDTVNARGFTITMNYSDGHGDAIKPKTREPLHLVGQCQNMNPSHFELTDEFTLTTGLKKLFDLGASVLSSGVPALLDEEQEYRKHTIESEKAENAVLGDGFWYFVYNDHTLKREDLERYLQTQESNAVLQSVPEKERAGLDYVYKRLGVIELSEQSAFWYIFWEDFFHQNKDMSILEDKLELFDPSSSTSICYRPLAKDDLKTFLVENEMYKEGDEDSALNKYCAWFIKQYFNREILDAMYAKMDKPADVETQNPMSDAQESPPQNEAV